MVKRIPTPSKSPTSFQYSEFQRQAAIKRQEWKNQQNFQNQLAQSQLNANLNSAYAQKGVAASSWTVSGLNHLLNTIPKASAKPQTPMEPPKFENGAKVTVRNGKTIWTVVRSEPYNYFDGFTNKTSHLYFLASDTGQQTREAEPELKSVAEAQKAKVDFDSVVISQEKRDQILEALEQVNQSDLIFNKWGFGDTIEKGRGVSMLFYGPPGTGKTLMGQAIANKLDKTLSVISTADVESSAPGEAERNIRKHFKEAKEKGNILLFDECDSLIYSRAGTGPIMSAQVNELLSQIERFDGITLFTTNRLGTLDEAVNRRLALKLEFSMPSPEERAEIWRRMFPEAAPLDADIDWMLLADFEITGGYIKNAVLRAARMAATEQLPDEKKTIKMKHLKKALRFEVESMMEFESARNKHEGNIGHTVTTSNGRKIVKKSEMDKVGGF